MWKSIISSIILVLVYNSYGFVRIDPLVDTKVGMIRGLKASDGDYDMFMGIPYATVDKNNVFGVAIPHPGFGDDVFEAYDDSAICPQVEEFNHTIVGTLDCLHLNVYVPNSASLRNQLPVLVWIHGGGFSYGFSGRFLYGPQYLVRHDVILVTLNYRLGPYGFMCLDTPEIPGNQGLKDQQIALKWIKNNIQAFGGDPDKITIYGESAGGASVDMQFTYGEPNLFDKLIMHSGSAQCPWVVEDSDLLAPLKLASQLGYSDENIDEAISFLSKTDPRLVIASAQTLGLSFWPCVEKEFEGVNRFIHDYPMNVVRPNAATKSVILAYNHDERMEMFETMAPEKFASLNMFYDDLSKNFNFDTESLTEMEEIIRHFYIGDEQFSTDVMTQLIDYSSDFNFVYPTVRSIQQYLAEGCTNVYNFVFSYDGGRNFVKHRLNLTSNLVTHADEMGLLFDISYMDTPTPEDQLAIDRITTLWTNFVKYGNPTPEVTDILPVQWPAVTKDTMSYLELSSNVTVGRRYFHERVAFWELFYKLNRESQIGYRSDSV